MFSSLRLVVPARASLVRLRQRRQGGQRQERGERAQYTTNGADPATSTSGPRSRSLAKRLAWLAGIAAGIYVVDLWANDDFDIWTDRFRTKLSEQDRKDRPHVVILGAGWGALSMLRKLHTDQFNVTVVSPRNYFLFTPLLPSATSGTVEVRSIIEPIRKYCKRSDAEEARFIEVEATKIDPENNTIHCVDTSSVKGTVSEFDLKYDHLIVAVGAESATFGIPGVRENAVFLKSTDDATHIRNRVLDCMETASIPGQPDDEVSRLLHFVVVGGGPAGVEYVADLHDWVERDIKTNFPELKDKVKITLVEALPHILNMFDAAIINRAEEKFTNTPGLEIMLRSAVTSVEPTVVKVKDANGQINTVPYGTLVWAAGNAPKPLVSDLISRLGPSNQPVRRALSVDEHLRVKGTNNIWALGDCSVVPQNYPATAQVASQEGRYLGRLFNEIADNLYQEKKGGDKSGLATALQKCNPFKYQHFGSFAYIGNWEAVAEFKPAEKSVWTVSGVSTFFLWRSVYMSKLLSFRNRVLVGFDWLKAWVFGRDVSRG